MIQPLLFSEVLLDTVFIISPPRTNDQRLLATMGPNHPAKEAGEHASMRRSSKKSLTGSRLDTETNHLESFPRQNFRREYPPTVSIFGSPRMRNMAGSGWATKDWRPASIFFRHMHQLPMYQTATCTCSDSEYRRNGRLKGKNDGFCGTL